MTAWIVGDPAERRADRRRARAGASRRSVRIAALPQAMSKPTPTTDTWSRYAADAADRHDVAEVAVGHERCVDCLFANVLELDERLFFVLSEDLHGSI